MIAPELVIVDSQNKVVDQIDFGIVQFKKSKELELFVYNGSEYDFHDLDFEISNGNIKVLEKPNNVPRNSKGKLKLLWTAESPLSQNPASIIIKSNYLV